MSLTLVLCDHEADLREYAERLRLSGTTPQGSLNPLIGYAELLLQNEKDIKKHDDLRTFIIKTLLPEKYPGFVPQEQPEEGERQPQQESQQQPEEGERQRQQEEQERQPQQEEQESQQQLEKEERQWQLQNQPEQAEINNSKKVNLCDLFESMFANN